MSDITTTDMDIDIDYSTSVPDAVAITGIGGGTMSYLHAPPYTQTELDKLVQPGIITDSTDSSVTFDTTPGIMASSTNYPTDVDTDYSSSIPSGEVIYPTGDVMDILKTRPIRNNLSDLVYPGLLADNTKAQFVEISDIRATNMDVDFDLPCGASGAWGALQLKGNIIPGTIHWSFDDFASELKTEAVSEVEYISGAGIPPYVVSGSDDPEAGTLNRDKEDFRFYTDDAKLRIEELALPLQWNEINLAMKSGSGCGLELLLATIV